MPTLFATPLSANARKPLAVADHLGLQIEVREVNVYAGEGRTPEFLSVNPSGKVPVLTEGDFVLTESNAILEYLCECAEDSALWSSDVRERAAISSWLFWEAAHWQPALTGILAPHVSHALLPDVVPAPPAPPEWDAPELAPLLDRIEDVLADRAFLAADRLTLADFSVAGMVTYFRSASFPFDARPRFRDWILSIEALPAWQRSAASLWSE